jgi:hypothetical protein
MGRLAKNIVVKIIQEALRCAKAEANFDGIDTEESAALSACNDYYRGFSRSQTFNSDEEEQETGTIYRDHFLHGFFFMRRRNGVVRGNYGEGDC